jgi:hypothetical protein
MMAMLDPDAEKPLWRKLTLGTQVLISLFGAVFFTGATMGVYAAISEKAGAGLLGYVIMAVAALLALGCFAFGMQRALVWQGKGGEPVAPRVQKSQRFAVLSGVVGFALAMVILVGEQQISPGAEPGILSNGPLPIWTAVLLIAVLVIVVPWLTLVWQRNADEHEQLAYKDGALYALYAYSMLSLVWWLGARADLLPPVDGIAVFVVTHFIWCGVWFYRRS